MSINFEINNKGKLSAAFLDRGINDFDGAMNYIRQLPYGRNKNKSDLISVFTDDCGTCGTKHALLKALIEENGQPGFRLMIGIFKMDNNYSAKVAPVLQRYQLQYIPEAHNYLRIDDGIIDCTTIFSSADSFINELLTEIEITPAQITDFKVAFHKKYLEQWLNEQKDISISFDELWNCREACIAALSN